jgi:hypothetical protein
MAASTSASFQLGEHYANIEYLFGYEESRFFPLDFYSQGPRNAIEYRYMLFLAYDYCCQFKYGRSTGNIAFDMREEDPEMPGLICIYDAEEEREDRACFGSPPFRAKL